MLCCRLTHLDRLNIVKQTQANCPPTTAKTYYADAFYFIVSGPLVPSQQLDLAKQQEDDHQLLLADVVLLLERQAHSLHGQTASLHQVAHGQWHCWLCQGGVLNSTCCPGLPTMQLTLLL